MITAEHYEVKPTQYTSQIMYSNANKHSIVCLLN